jgi:uncharacterized protein YqeY
LQFVELISSTFDLKMKNRSYFGTILMNMNLKQQLDQDLKAAMLSGDKTLVTTLRGLKSVILYAEVAAGNREKGLDDAVIVELFTKEVKKRQESADLYKQGGNMEKAQAELTEKTVIQKYLPEQLSEEELGALIDQAVEKTGASGPQSMGQVIGLVKQLSKGRADGSRIAAAAKERLQGSK